MTSKSKECYWERLCRHKIKNCRCQRKLVGAEEKPVGVTAHGKKDFHKDFEVDEIIDNHLEVILRSVRMASSKREDLMNRAKSRGFIGNQAVYDPTKPDEKIMATSQSLLSDNEPVVKALVEVLDTQVSLSAHSTR
jgi:hypothetical protein